VLEREIQHSRQAGLTDMIVEQRSTISRNVVWKSAPWNKYSVARDYPGRLIQIALALYLIPALLGVLVVGSVGIMVVGVGRLLISPVRGTLG
jgi:hypothetical protein